MKTLTRVLSYLRPYSALAAFNILFNILTVVFSLFSVVMVIPFLQLLFKEIPPVMQQPQFALTADYVLEDLKYYSAVK